MKQLMLLSILFLSLVLTAQDYKPRPTNVDSLKKEYNKGVIYDSLVAVVTYVNKEAKQQIDTCKIYLEAKKCYVFYDFGQFKNCDVKMFKTNEYIVYPNWEILRCVRFRKNESLYRARIINFKTIKNR